MKTEKKPNEPSCCPPATVVKDEPDADSIKEENTGGNNDDATGEDTTECQRDPCLDPSNGEGAMTGEKQNTNGNQPMLNSVKQEGDPHSTDDLSGEKNLFVTISGSLFLLYLYITFFSSHVSYVNRVIIFAVDCRGNNVIMDSTQPLVSNVVGKQMGSGTGEAQYMQQQSQIFVFSTKLANAGAEAVLRQEYSSILAYHCAQPGTKKCLEVFYAQH